MSLYRVNNTKGLTCILISTDGILDITYRTASGEDVTANTFLPDDVELSGECAEQDISSMTMKFKGFSLYMLFKKTPGGERWYVATIDLAYSSSNPLLKQIDRPNLEVSSNFRWKVSDPLILIMLFIQFHMKQVRLSNDKNQLLFPTPVGKSYMCNESDIILYSRVSNNFFKMFVNYEHWISIWIEIVYETWLQDENDRAGHTAILNLRELRMQSFMYRAANSWGPPFQCSATGNFSEPSQIFTDSSSYKL